MVTRGEGAPNPFILVDSTVRRGLILASGRHSP